MSFIWDPPYGSKAFKSNNPSIACNFHMEKNHVCSLDNTLLIRVILKPNSIDYTISRYGKKYGVKLGSLGGCL
jgi:hypothetical protein